MGMVISTLPDSFGYHEDLRGQGFESCQGASECAWAVVGRDVEGSATQHGHFPASPRVNILTTDGQGGRLTLSNCSLPSWGDAGPERGGDLLTELELGLTQGSGLHNLLPLCGPMD